MNLEKKVIITLVALAIAVAAWFYVRNREVAQVAGPQVAITIEGLVRKPGLYYVPVGTTRFEVLRVAGVMPVSDLNNIDVYAQVTDGEQLNVGELEKSVNLKSGGSYGGRACVVNFLVGEASIAGKAGSRKPEKAMPVFEGEKVQCGSNGTLELKLGDESLVDLRAGGSLQIQDLYKTAETGLMATTLMLEQGRLWAYLKPQPENVSLQFTTAHMAAEIKGTEIELSTDTAKSELWVIKGMVYAGRPGSDRRTTVAEGQKALFSADPTLDPVVANLTDEDKAKRDEDKTLQQEKEKAQVESSVRRFMVLLLPDYYMLMEMDPSKGVYSISRISHTTDVSEYIEGVRELGKVYLYGGVRLTTSVIERMARKKIEKYAVMQRKDAEDMINKLGGIYLNVDESSAKLMEVKPGLQKLNGSQAAKYVGAGMRGTSGREGGIERQNTLLKALFEASMNKKLVFSQVLVTTLMKGVESDMDVNYTMSAYKTFSAKSDWKMQFTYLVPQ